MGWQFFTDILQGVYIPAGKNLSSKRDLRKIPQEDFFASLLQETPIYVTCRDNGETMHIVLPSYSILQHGIIVLVVGWGYG